METRKSHALSKSLIKHNNYSFALVKRQKRPKASLLRIVRFVQTLSALIRGSLKAKKVS